jgi:F-type H+-transporting ATPase subunit a
MLVLIVAAWGATRNLQLVPTGFQNFMEIVIEALHGLVHDVAGEKRAAKFFPIVTTIFLFVLVSNWLDLLTPILSVIGFVEHHDSETVIIPILRSPSTDLNTTLGLALISVVLTQIFGVQALGLFGYVGRFINVKGFGHFVLVLLRRRKGNPMGALFTAFLDLFVGLLELVSEFAKIISFSFRLFGNIFAGEVLLLVIPSFLSILLPLPFLGLEVFVGLIQAFIFAVLTLAFMTMATTSHEHGEGH